MRNFLFKLFMLLCLLPAAATAQDVELKEFTWIKQQFKMNVPDVQIVQESDSMAQLEGPQARIYVWAEDRSLTTEEDCVLWMMDQARKNKADWNNATFKYSFGKRSVGAYIYCPYDSGEGGIQTMGIYCGIDKESRRIYTVIAFLWEDARSAIEQVISSPDVMDINWQY